MKDGDRGGSGEVVELISRLGGVDIFLGFMMDSPDQERRVQFCPIHPHEKLDLLCIDSRGQTFLRNALGVSYCLCSNSQSPRRVALQCQVNQMNRFLRGSRSMEIGWQLLKSSRDIDV